MNYTRKTVNLRIKGSEIANDLLICGPQNCRAPSTAERKNRPPARIAASESFGSQPRNGITSRGGIRRLGAAEKDRDLWQGPKVDSAARKLCLPYYHSVKSILFFAFRYRIEIKLQKTETLITFESERSPERSASGSRQPKRNARSFSVPNALP